MSASEIATAISAALPQLKSGSLRFWGNWFGRPYDNWHHLLRCESQNTDVILSFDNGETLTVTEPVGLEMNVNVFSIRQASVVRWEWFYYGLPKSAENRYFQEYVHDGKTIVATTNADRSSPDLNLSASESAVEFL